MISDPADNDRAGAAWVFTRSGSTWTQQGSKLTGSGGSADAQFGTSVALSTDGSTALIGGVGDNGGPALSERGERFLRGLRGRLVAVSALRCEGHSARLLAPAIGTGPLSVARAALFCRALVRLAGDDVRPTVVGHGTAQPIASNDTESGRARNRRVVVTLTHRPGRLR